MYNNKISIIVPVYNCEKYLKECLDSIVNQTYKNIEVLLIDDGSKDFSGKICDEYAKENDKIKVYHITNKGVSNARNTGIKLSTGDWITFVDSDDIISEDYCSSLINSIDSDTDMVIGRTISFRNDNINLKVDDGFKGDKVNLFSSKTEKNELYKSIFIDNKKLIKYPHISTCSAKLIRKDLIVTNNIKYDLNMYLYEDAYFNMQIINLSKKIIVLDKEIYFYRYNQNSSSNTFKKEAIEQYDYVYSKISSFEKKNNLYFEEYIDYFKIKNLNTILTNYCKDDTCKNKYIKKICNLPVNLSAIKRVKIKNLPKKRMLLVIFSRMHMYFIIRLLYKIK